MIFNFKTTPLHSRGFLPLTTRNFSIGILPKMSIQDSVRDLIANLICEKIYHVSVFVLVWWTLNCDRQYMYTSFRTACHKRNGNVNLAYCWNLPGCPSPTDSDVKRKVLFWVSGLFILNLFREGLTRSSLKLPSLKVWLMSALQCFLFNLLGDRPCSGLLELALSLVKLTQNREVMKDLSPGAQLSTWVRNGHDKIS